MPWVQESTLHGNQKQQEVEGIGLFVAWFYTAPWFLYPLCEEPWKLNAKLDQNTKSLILFRVKIFANLDTTFLKSRLIGKSRSHVSDVCQFITELSIWRCQSSGQRSQLFESSSSIFSWDKWQYPPPLLVHNKWTFPSPSNIWKGWSKFLCLSTIVNASIFEPEFSLILLKSWYQ